MSETRKLAAILAADVVGYSRLAGADESSRPDGRRLLSLSKGRGKVRAPYGCGAG